MKDSDIEARLLSDASLDELIKMKIEKEYMSDLKKLKEKSPEKIYKNICEVPKDKIFSKEAVFKIFNRNSGCETLINGIQAEALIGTQNNIREKMLKGELDAFTTDDSYIKFEKVIF